MYIDISARSTLPDQTVGSSDAINAVQPKDPIKVGIIGGGAAGSTVAIRLASLGIETYLFEQKPSLIDGPPMCHLHAGGNLYRDIPDSACVALLEQGIEMVRLYPHSIDVRPTVIAVPLRDNREPNDLLPRLKMLTETYQHLVSDNPANAVLGKPEHYYQVYDKAQMTRLANLPQVDKPTTTDEWVSAAARYLDLNKLKYPVVAVQEYGWNIFRLAAHAEQALEHLPHAHVFTQTCVQEVTPIVDESAALESTDNIDLATVCDTLNTSTMAISTITQSTITQNTINQSTHDNSIRNVNSASVDFSSQTQQWCISYSRKNDGQQANNCDDIEGDNVDSHNLELHNLHVDYLINASGFRTGSIDDMVGVVADKMVEFKASYVSQWTDGGGQLPEIIIHGTRGTPHGMVQLTPYPDSYYQIHAMSTEVTLFADGLVKTLDDAPTHNGQKRSSQPTLNPEYVQYINKGWSLNALQARSQRAIDAVSEFVPSFASAKVANKALYGAQQIPGQDDSLRVADVRLYRNQRYARVEIVKASSTLQAADAIVDELQEVGLLKLTEQDKQNRAAHRWQHLAEPVAYHPLPSSQSETDTAMAADKQLNDHAKLSRLSKLSNQKTIDAHAKKLALKRQFPVAMAGVNNAVTLPCSGDV